jgi:restriction endonuclease-like protein
MTTDRYRRALRENFATYRRRNFSGASQAFEARPVNGAHPTVFKKAHHVLNVLTPPAATEEQVDEIRSSLHYGARHRWFGSMASSQALCQSVFGSLKAMDQIGVLQGIDAGNGMPAFFESAADAPSLELESFVNTLSEPRPTCLDAYFAGSHRVAVEVKFAETEFGTCSRPRLTPQKASFERDHCDGTLTHQRGRQERCSLTEQKIRYWEFIPQLFHWSAMEDVNPCPLAQTYQLVRNLLAVSVNPDGAFDTTNAHVLVIYDSRNPAFAPGGAADAQWQQTVAALRFPKMLRRLSWQHLAGHLAAHDSLHWLVDGLRRKYGIIGQL